MKVTNTQAYYGVYHESLMGQAPDQMRVLNIPRQSRQFTK